MTVTEWHLLDVPNISANMSLGVSFTLDAIDIEIKYKSIVKS
jgi:hypothetical protein